MVSLYRKLASVLILMAALCSEPGHAQQSTADEPPLLPMFTKAPDGTIKSYVLPEDYPASLTHGERGDVEFRFTIGTNGHVTSCTITRSSSYEALDKATCKAFSRRAKFKPALDAQGQPVESVMRSKMRWGPSLGG